MITRDQPSQTGDRRILVAVPNCSVGAGSPLLEPLHQTRELLDTSSDSDHNRTVITYGGSVSAVIRACRGLAELAVSMLDLSAHRGAHPRFGVIDVLPFVPYGVEEQTAHQAAQEVVADLKGLGLPAYLYGRLDPGGRSLPELRRFLRSTPHEAHPTAGVVCVGVRDPLVAFNVNFGGSIHAARDVARRARAPALRALGFELPSRGLVQVSMNLVEPEHIGPKTAFERVVALARERELQLVDCEVVGLVPHPILDELERLPLRKPARSIEQALAEKGLGG